MFDVHRKTLNKRFNIKRIEKKVKKVEKQFGKIIRSEKM